MKERLKKLAVVLMFGFVLYYGASNGMARQGLPTVEERVYGVSQIWKKAADHYALWELADREPTWDVAYIEEYFEKVVPLIQDSDGVILDVRSNAGGNSLVGHTILESFKGEAIEYRWQAADTIKISSYVNNYAFWNYYMKVAEDDTNPELAARMSRTLEAAAEQSGGEWDAVMEIGKDMYYGRFEVSDRVMNALQEDFKEKYPDVWEKMEAEKQSDQKKNGQESESSPLIGKPVVLLIGPNSGSATDTMAAEAKAAGFVLVGTRTRGATGNVLRIDAGGGWQVGISTQRGLTLEGKDINNNGIEATVFVEQNEEDAMNGVDTQVVKATEVLREMIE